ncbi:MAG: HAMP domain-containing histidine kinase [Bacteroidales bacterium]|jgi:signal transduction histidine kinase|nr:HAMP domain-containing histidine kinase [Bacteroidales bacterium]
MYLSGVPLRLLTIFVCLLFFAKLVEKNILFPKFNQHHAGKIQKIFLKKEQKLTACVEKIKHCIDTSHPDSCFIRFHNALNEISKEGLYCFVYRNDSLQYWSSKDVPAALLYRQSEFDKPYIGIIPYNGINKCRYASFVHTWKEYKIVGLILIKNIYTDENKYLQTAFQEDFGLPSNIKIFPEMKPGYFPICDSKGQFIWALIFDDTCHYRYQTWVPAVTYFLAILVFFLLIDALFRRIRKARLKNCCLPFVTVALVMLRYLMQQWRMPSYFYEVEIFSPVYFASEWFPSLGDLMLWSIFTCFIVVEIYRHFRFPASCEHRWKYFLSVVILLFAAVCCFFASGWLIKTLVINSTDMFEGPNHTILLNSYSFLGYVIILLWMLACFLLLDKTLICCRRDMRLHRFFILYVIILSVEVTVCLLAGWYISSFSVAILSAMMLIMGTIRLKQSVKYGYSHFILLVFILSIYATVHISRFSVIKYDDQKKVIITNLATSHDLTSEFLLRDISERIIADTALTEIMYERDQEKITDYIKRAYFYNPYWNTYQNYQCVVCGERDSLNVSGERIPSCVNFFRKNIEKDGTQLPRSQFYYINRQQTDAYASYLGWFRKEKENAPPLHLFIEVWIGGGTDIGYPELLLDNRAGKENNLKGYSHARYRNNRRISQSGIYNYNLSGDIFRHPDQGDYHTVIADEMEHLVYSPDKSNMIVLSSYAPKYVDFIINFSYIFILSFLIVSVGTLLFRLPVKHVFRWSLRNRIQYSMIISIIASFGIIGIYTVFYINRQYQDKNNDLINEKMQSVYKELLNVILLQMGHNEHWTENRDELTVWLMDMRNMFFTDINLFDVNGSLIASSVPDVFNKGLVSRQINPDAFIKLTFGQRASILEKEAIGGLKYISAYEPFVDNNNNVIAFLNLPYFTQQDDLTEEISSLVLAITNFYMIIILLTVIISVVVSNQITHPLILLQEKFRNIKLGEKNEPIRYGKNDEIGNLVKEYNRAIEELARSASRLARSERESAWREMAKQIAHEINNPLTPMKLSIQHLKRAWDNQSERFGEYMEKISHSLIEQIDTMSSIATEFSNFAKMPSVHNRQLNLITRINDVVPLFATGDNKRAFHTNYHGLSEALIYADKEQISRVFINLFKNALQAIPKEREASIHVDVLKLNRMVWIRIKDNGTGIPENMQEKIFQPNFTTKSSGMGVGLTIVRNIIESAGGTISFRTKNGEGTTFIISLPSVENEE